MIVSPDKHCLEQWKVSHKHGTYPVCIGENLLPNLSEYIPDSLARSRACIVSDRCVAWHYLKTVETAFINSRITLLPPFQFHPGERSKSMATFSRLLNHLLSIGMSRNDFIIALGGGVTGDLAGFAAATFMRGIPFIQLPTSLLAQADSSIGGKTAINLPAGKNLAGAFHFPELVVTDIATLDTLPRRHLVNGLAEIIKIAVIGDASLLNLLHEHAETICQPEHRYILGQVLNRACQLKAEIVQEDERETGIRAWLNLGHTFGHALEKTLGFGKILHGEAVALGMLGATRLAITAGMCQSSLLKQLETTLQTVGLPVYLPAIDTDAVLKAMNQDKKKKGNIMRLVLPIAAGTVQIVENPSIKDLRAAIESLTRDPVTP